MLRMGQNALRMGQTLFVQDILSQKCVTQLYYPNRTIFIDVFYDGFGSFHSKKMFRKGRTQTLILP